MSFNVRKVGNSFKINYIGGKGRPTNVNKIPSQDQLQSLNIAYLGRPFNNTVSKFQDTRSLDMAYLGQPFYASSKGYAISSSKIIVNNNHPDVQNWLNTIIWNGGSVSPSTISALNIFCRTIDTAGIRNRFYRLNLFCGNNLQACLVPLYVSPVVLSAGGLQTSYGYASDINFNFTNSDYNETGVNGGLKGDGNVTTTKYLSTGLLPSSMNGSLHMCASVVSDFSVNQHFLGVDNAFDSGWTACNIDSVPISTIPRLRAALGDSAGPRDDNNTIPSAFRVIGTSLRTAGSQSILYRNGSAVATASPTYLTLPQYGFYIFGTNRKNSIATSSLGTARLSSYSIGQNLTSSDVAAYEAALVAFQTALGRNI